MQREWPELSSAARKKTWRATCRDASGATDQQLPTLLGAQRIPYPPGSQASKCNSQKPLSMLLAEARSGNACKAPKAPTGAVTKPSDALHGIGSLTSVGASALQRASVLSLSMAA